MRSVYGVGLNGIFVLVPLLLWAVGLFALYWIIRLAVRHGVLDAERRPPPEKEAGPRRPGERPPD